MVVWGRWEWVFGAEGKRLNKNALSNASFVSLSWPVSAPQGLSRFCSAVGAGFPNLPLADDACRGGSL